MAIAKTVNSQNRVDGSFESVDTMTQSTATTVQNVSLTTNATSLGMGTATGFARNRYLLPAGNEGQHKWIYSTGTGEAYLDVAGSGTATGSYTFSGTVVPLYHFFVYINSSWRAMAGNATLATATNS